MIKKLNYTHMNIEFILVKISKFHKKLNSGASDTQ